VISAAIEFEKKAVKYYSENSEKTASESEKKIFQWLAEWEKKHLHMLASIDKELKEKIWYDNRFWPLD
jgi:rubrerythrin